MAVGYRKSRMCDLYILFIIYYFWLKKKHWKILHSLNVYVCVCVCEGMKKPNYTHFVRHIGHIVFWFF